MKCKKISPYSQTQEQKYGDNTSRVKPGEYVGVTFMIPSPFQNWLLSSVFPSQEMAPGMW